MKRKSLILVLTVVMMMSCLSIPTFAATDESAAEGIENEQVQNEPTQEDQVQDEQAQNDDSAIKEDIMNDIDELDSEEATKEETTAPKAKAKAKKAKRAKKMLKAPVLKKTMQSTKRVLLRWSRVKGASGYLVYKNSKKKVFKKFGKKRTKFLMKNVKPGQANSYVVKAYKVSKGKVAVGKTSNKLRIKTPKVLKQSSKYFKETNAYKVIKAAKKKLGCAYVSGAAGPRAFDCSGYTYYVYNKMKSVKKIGTKRFTRSSAQGNYNALKKYNIGRDISKAQPGDIMLFSHSGRPGNIHHAALYYGNGKIIHASSPSTGVLISRIAFRKVAAIIRLPKM